MIMDLQPQKFSQREAYPLLPEGISDDISRLFDISDEQKNKILKNIQNEREKSVTFYTIGYGLLMYGSPFTMFLFPVAHAISYFFLLSVTVTLPLGIALAATPIERFITKNDLQSSRAWPLLKHFVAR